MDEFFMKRALKLAIKGKGHASPNPMVGALIVKEGKIIGEGYHKKFGENHAEINAINHASESIEGATFYVTLEPCSHYGKTPPCAERIVDVKASRVVIGTTDPNPLVSGKGIEILENHGIKTKVGILQRECVALNEKYFKFIKTRIPFVTLKYAQTIDGRIATSATHSQWISSGPSLKYAHKLRSHHDGILVGIGTVLKDDPDLTVRLVRGRNPLRIVCDSNLQIPVNARILQNQKKAKTLVATTPRCSGEKLASLEGMGIEVLVIDKDGDNHVDLKKLLVELGKREISSVLVEGGSKIITSLVKEKLFDRMMIITAPKILGKGIEAIGDLGIEKMIDSIGLTFERVYRKGDDVVIDARIEK
jgi:diaminohydroxyphosphoribosylaminopyrimidine deaminase/5-amino-6-(5-phosphoribosylamino)uracil reductase